MEDPVVPLKIWICFIYASAIILGINSYSPVAWAQFQPFDRPGDIRPELPQFESAPPERVLPEIPIPKGKDTQGLRGGAQIFIQTIRVRGNTVISNEEIAQITAPYTNKNVYLSDLEKLRDQLTLAYLNKGYINSGAVIPDQDIKNGIFTYQIIEGNLTDLEVQTDGRFRTNYFRKRLRRDSDGPLNILQLERRLQLLQLDDRVRRIEAQLRPTETRGGSRLSVNVKESKPYRFEMGISNHQVPTVGNVRGHFIFSHANLLGLGDRVSATLQKSEGFESIDASYGIPLNSYDTTFKFHYRENWAEILEEPFNALNIESNSVTIGGTLTQPLYRSPNSSFSVFVTGEHKRTDSFIFGDPFSFAEGPDDGVSQIMAIRFGQDFVYRGRNQVFSARSTMSVGLDALGATVNGGETPDGQYFSWLGQIQYARRFPWSNLQVVVRGDAQMTDSPMLGLEQFPVGGHASVRGYRENQLVDDNGSSGSIEIRMPVWRDIQRGSYIEFGVFSDAGYSWNNRDELSPGQDTLLSAGVGVRMGFNKRLQMEVYWGHQFREVIEASDRDTQDDGIHFSGTFIVF